MTKFINWSLLYLFLYIWKELFVDILYYWPFGFMVIALMFIQLRRGLKSLPYLSRTQTPFAKGFRENKVVFRIYRSIKRLIDQPIAKRSVNHKSKKKKWNVVLREQLWDGLYLVNATKTVPKQPVGELWQQSWRRSVWNGARHNTKAKTDPYGGRSLMPCVPVGTKRTKLAKLSCVGWGWKRMFSFILQSW